MNYSDMGWRYGIAGIFVLTCCVGLGVTLLLYKLSRKRADAVADAAAERDWQALQAVIEEQTQHNQAARRILQLADTIPSLPALLSSNSETESDGDADEWPVNPNCRSVLIPAQALDASDTTPTVELEPGISHCPTCFLRSRVLDGSDVEPMGKPRFCAEHAYTTLARTYARSETGRPTDD